MVHLLFYKLNAPPVGCQRMIFWVLRSVAVVAVMIKKRMKKKNLILKINFAEAKELADSAIKLSAAREVRKLLQEKIKTYE